MDDKNPRPAAPSREQITAAEQANDAALQALAQRYGVQFDGGAIMGVKFDVLVTTLFGPPGTDTRRAFDWAMVERFRQVVAEAEAEVRRMALQANRNGLIVPGPGYRPNGRPVRDNPQA
jgi:hypothetical protein